MKSTFQKNWSTLGHQLDLFELPSLTEAYEKLKKKKPTRNFSNIILKIPSLCTNKVRMKKQGISTDYIIFKNHTFVLESIYWIWGGLLYMDKKSALFNTTCSKKTQNRWNKISTISQWSDISTFSMISHLSEKKNETKHFTWFFFTS